jgi:hypothetical protein
MPSVGERVAPAQAHQPTSYTVNNVERSRNGSVPEVGGYKQQVAAQQAAYCSSPARHRHNAVRGEGPRLEDVHVLLTCRVL